jgi:hypothetical protein
MEIHKIFLAIVIVCIIIFVICTYNNTNISIRKNVGKLYSNIPKHKIPSKINCFDKNGDPTNPILTESRDYVCKYYYGLDDAGNPLPVQYTRTDVGDVRDVYNYCSSTDDCSYGRVYYSDIDYDDYMRFPSTDNITSGYRVDQPYDSNSTVFLRINGYSSIGDSNWKSNISVSSIEECESECSKEYTSGTGYLIQGCYTYEYNDENGTCSIYRINNSGDPNNYINPTNRKFMKSPYFE